MCVDMIICICARVQRMMQSFVALLLGCGEINAYPDGNRY